MTRDETVALFLQGKKAWNAWAEKMLAERKAMEADGRWAAERRPGWAVERKYPWDKLEPKNEETGAWIEAAAADLSHCRFLVRGGKGINEAAGETKKEDRSPPPPVKSTSIDGDVINFEGFVFPGDADFRSATFSGYADFRSAAFSGIADFRSAAFSGDAYFRNAAFTGYANFRVVAFKDHARFDKAKFLGSADLGGANFFTNAFFLETTFFPSAFFGLARFEQFASFEHAHFLQNADFGAISGVRAFTLADTVFEGVPDFIQAHFEEALRLDNLKVIGRAIDLRPQPEREKAKRRAQSRRLFAADRNVPARWRALKRLAIQGHDTDRELEFHAREVRSQRFAGDRPLPLAFWRGKNWGGFFRFWFGILYQITSDFGRSLARPFAFWALGIVIFAVYYLGQNLDLAAARHRLNHQGFFRQAEAYSTVARQAVTGTLPAGCVKTTLPAGDSKEDSQNGLTGLTEPVGSRTNLVNEALSIAYHNAVIVLDSSGDSAHRVFGCLYGVERYGGNPVAYVPRNVAIASGMQKLFSAIFIFLFGLAVRNMLKVK
jgi:Pentapeptide repeats (9 copies)